ncbi:MAG: anaerobic sulfatase maturase [Sedimentisphaerales bacterium]|nr:anaerobic sulfatase maturase [Sedimentisphaerales bacterium]
MRPFSLLIKPSGPDCNIACKYCFYSGKTSLFGQGRHRMSGEVLEELIKSYLQLDFPVHALAWQGGEPTLMGLDFFRQAVELQKKYGKKGRVVSNSLQTNSVLLDDEWCKFLSEFKFLVGISLDGPRWMHDTYRLDCAGRGTFDKVIAAVEKCGEHDVQFNILVLLNDINVKHPDEVFDFFVGLDIRYLQFITCAERDRQSGELAPFSITAQEYGDFLCRIFDRWFEYGPRKLSIRLFDSIMSYYLQGRHTDCTFGERCDEYIVVEHNGDVFCCDFFVEEKWKLGNILETPIGELFNSDTKRIFAREKRRLSNKCFVCRHLPLCRGGCPKDRIVEGGDSKSPNYFCAGYKQFFDHALSELMKLSANI